MSELYFKVNKENNVHNKYFEEIKRNKKINTIVKNLLVEYGLETKSYRPRNDVLEISPTKADQEKLGKQLRKGSPTVLRALNKRSHMNKKYLELLKENDVVISAPVSMQVIFDFATLGRCGVKLIHSDSEVYGRLTAPLIPEQKIPEGYEIIKASEFHTILEELRESK